MKKYAILLTAACMAMPHLIAGDQSVHTPLCPQKYIGKSLKATSAVLYLPTKETAYEYEDGKEVLYDTYEYTYDKRGNRTTDYINGTYYTLKHNENNKVIERTPENKEESKSTFDYDPVVTDYIIDRQDFDYDDLDGAFTQKAYQHHVDITRDEQGKVTGWTRSVLRPGTTNQLDPTNRVTITYGADGNAKTWTMGTSNNDLIMQEDQMRYDNIRWQNTNHQIVRETDYFVIGDNRISYADVYVKGELYGTFKASYTNEADFESVLTTIDEFYERHYYQIKDAYGSYVEGFENKGIDENQEAYHTTSRQEASYDEHGNMTSLLTYTNDALQPSQKFEHTYDDMGRLTQTIEYTTEDGKTWNKFMRIVYSDFIEVTPSGVDTPAAEGKLQATVSDGTLHLSGTDMRAYTIYSVNGTVISAGSIAADRADISLAGIQAGIYIASVTTVQGNTQVKFVVK